MGLGNNIRANMRRPAGLAAAVLLGVVAALVTAQRTTASWLVIPIGIGVGVVVLIVYAALAEPVEVAPEPVAAPLWPNRRETVVPQATAQARDLLRRTCMAAVEVRVRAVTVADTDPVMAPTSRVVDTAYRLAALVARHDGDLPQACLATALNALGVGAQRMEDVAGRIDGPAANRITVLVDDLNVVKRDLESAESTVKAALS